MTTPSYPAQRPVPRASVAAFWTFAFNRQEVWHRRTVLGLPYPWTDDPVLRGCHFTNVHRELDRATMSLVTAIERHAAAPSWVKVANCALFRWLRAGPGPWEAIGGWVDWADDDDVDRAMTALHAAWMTRANGFFGQAGQPPTGHQITPVVTMLRDVLPVVVPPTARLLDDLARAGHGTGEMYAQLHRRRTRGFAGIFTITQLVLDTTLVHPQVGVDWLPIRSGPTNVVRGSATPIDVSTGKHRSTGPRVALLRMDQGEPGVLPTDVDPVTAVRWLRDHQRRWLGRDGELGLPWEDVAWTGRPQLNLADLEHTLCEYDKYERLRITTKRARQYRGPARH